MVLGEKWDFYGLQLVFNNKSFIFDFFYEQKNMREELDECGIIEGQVCRYLIRKVGKLGLDKVFIVFLNGRRLLEFVFVRFLKVSWK